MGLTFLGWKICSLKMMFSDHRKTFGTSIYLSCQSAVTRQGHAVVGCRFWSLTAWVWISAPARTKHTILAASFIFLIVINVCLSCLKAAFWHNHKENNVMKHYWECLKTSIKKKNNGMGYLVICEEVKERGICWWWSKEDHSDLCI